MIIPKYWAEAKRRDQVAARQVTVRRFGWSNESEADAERHAAERLEDAFARLRAGETLAKREPKRGYNGADGVPIREEIVAEYGDTIITRNSYGALCLNSSRAFFIDLDEPTFIGIAGCLMPLVSGVMVFFFLNFIEMPAVGAAAGIIVAIVVGVVIEKRGLASAIKWQRQKLAAIRRFVALRPNWRMRVYRTPAGLRLLAMHRPFDPHEAEVSETFDVLGADAIYVRMCLHQNCFRARVSPKPWNIGIPNHITPRGVWPIDSTRMPERGEWIAFYESASENFASCQFLEELGDGPIDSSLIGLQELHDQLSRANDDLPLA